MYAVYYIYLSLLLALRHFRNAYQRQWNRLPWQYIWGFNIEILRWYFLTKAVKQTKNIRLCLSNVVVII